MARPPFGRRYLNLTRVRLKCGTHPVVFEANPPDLSFWSPTCVSCFRSRLAYQLTPSKANVWGSWSRMGVIQIWLLRTVVGQRLRNEKQLD